MRRVTARRSRPKGRERKTSQGELPSGGKDSHSQIPSLPTARGAGENPTPSATSTHASHRHFLLSTGGERDSNTGGPGGSIPRRDSPMGVSSRAEGPAMRGGAGTPSHRSGIPEQQTRDRQAQGRVKRLRIPSPSASYISLLLSLQSRWIFPGASDRFASHYQPLSCLNRRTQNAG
jgi:hypothetical protein